MRKIVWFKFDSFDRICACAEEIQKINGKNHINSASKFDLTEAILIRNTQKCEKWPDLCKNKIEGF